MNRFHDEDPVAAEILATPVETLRRELEEAGLYPVDPAEAYPEAFAYFATRAEINKAANDDEERLVRMAAFDGSGDAPATIGDAPDAGLIGQIAGAQGRAVLALRGGAVELRLERTAAISRLQLNAKVFDLSAVDGSDLVYIVNELSDEDAYRFWFDHDQTPDSHPVSWS